MVCFSPDLSLQNPHGSEDRTQVQRARGPRPGCVQERGGGECREEDRGR